MLDKVVGGLATVAILFLLADVFVFGLVLVDEPVLKMIEASLSVVAPFA